MTPGGTPWIAVLNIDEIDLACALILCGAGVIILDNEDGNLGTPQHHLVFLPGPRTKTVVTSRRERGLGFAA